MRSTKSVVLTPFTTPVQITSSEVQQFRILNGNSSFGIGVAPNTIAITGTTTISFGTPTQFSGSRTRQLIYARLPWTHVANGGSAVVIPANEIGGIVRISEGTGLADGFQIRLPASSACTAFIGITVAMNDTIDMIIENQTSKSALIALTDIVNDTMEPLDSSGRIIIAARSQMLVTCIFNAVIAPAVVSASWMIGTYGGSSSMGVFASVGAFPPAGDATTLYVAGDTNRLYRYQTGSRVGGYNWMVGPGGDFPTLQAALASASVLDGHKIYILNGIYPITTAMTISKQVQIFGQSRNDVLLLSAGTATDPVVLITVAANNVALRGMTIRHQKTTNSSVEVAVFVSGAGSTVVSNFIMDDCTVEYMKHGIAMRGNAWKINNTTVSYVGANNSTKRAILLYNTAGNSFLTRCSFLNNGTLGNYRTIHATSAGVPADVYTGTLAIEDCTHTGLQTMFYIQDSFTGTPGGYNVLFKRNTADEVSVFASFWCPTNLGGDTLGQITSENNTISNASGKCAITLETPSNLITFSSHAIPIHVAGNTLASLVVGPGYTLCIGASNYSATYSSFVSTPPVSVVQDAIIPVTPVAPTTPTIWSTVAGYWELSPELPTRKECMSVLSSDDLVGIALRYLAFPESIIVSRNRSALNQGFDYLVATSTVGGTTTTRLTWAGTIIAGGSEQLVVGDKISVVYTGGT